MGVDMDQLEAHLKNVVNKTWNFAGRCNNIEDEIQNAVLGLAGEAGETADQVKKMLYHTPKPGEHHREKLRYELGDVYYYLLKLQDLMGFTTEEILEANLEKLASRHPELGKVKERYGKDAIR